jgi:hypothetical protein
MNLCCKIVVSLVELFYPISTPSFCLGKRHALKWVITYYTLNKAPEKILLKKKSRGGQRDDPKQMMNVPMKVEKIK